MGLQTQDLGQSVLDGLITEEQEPTPTATPLEERGVPRPNARVHAERMLARAQEAVEPRAGADLLVRAAELFEREERDPAAAFGALAGALRRDPGHPFAPAALERVAGVLESYPAALEILGTAIQTLKARNAEAVRRLWLRVASIALDRHPMPELCREALARAAELGADAPETLAMRAAYELKHGRYRDAAESLRKQAAAETNPRARLEILLTRARLCDTELRDPVRAMESYNAALAIDPTHDEALKAIEALSAATHDWDRHLAVLDSRLALAQSTGERIALYRRMASVWERKKSDRARAARCFEAILARDEADVDALAELERLHRDGERWPELIEALRRRASVASDAGVRARLWKKIAGVLEQRLGRHAEARDAINEALALAPADREALQALARLDEFLADATGAAMAVERLVRLTPDAPAKVLLHERAAQLHVERSGTGGKKPAQKHLHEALALDPGNVSAARELARLYREAKEWARAKKVVLACEPHAASPADRAGLLAAAAQLTEDHLGDADDALSLWHRVLAHDPEHPAAARAIVELELAAGRPEDAAEAAETLARRAADPESSLSLEERVLAHALAGRIALATGQKTRAKKHFAAAEAYAPDHVMTLLGQGELALADGRADVAEARWLKALDRQERAHARPRAIADTLCRLAQAKKARNDWTGAAACALQALGEDAAHIQALELTAELGEHGGDHEAAVRARQALASRAQGSAKLQHLVALADAHMAADEFEPAVRVFAEAVKLRPRDPQLLGRALAACEAAGRPRDASVLALRLVDLTEDRGRRGALYVKAARIAKENLGAPRDAMGYYNLALDDFAAAGHRAGFLEAAEEIIRLCRKQGDHAATERTLRKLIARLPEREPLAGRLWRLLGELYRDQLGAPERATEAFQHASALEPDAPARVELASLAEESRPRTPRAAAPAVRQRFALLAADGYNPDHYHALFRLYRDSRQIDKAWCVARALVFFRRATSEERRLVNETRPEGALADGGFSPEVWRLLRADGEDAAVSAITRAIREAVLRTQAVPPAKLRRRGNDDAIGARGELVRRAFARVSRLLGVAMPELIYRPEDAGGLRLVPLLERPRAPLGIAFVLGRDWLARYRTTAELEGAAAHVLAQLRPEHTLRRVLATRGDLRTAVYSALLLARPGTQVPLVSQAAVASYVPRLAAALGPTARGELEMVAQQLSPDAQLDLDGWCLAVDEAARRTTLVVSGDLELAARSVAAEGARPGGPKATELIRDLVIYSVSEAHFEIRRKLGTTVV